MAAEQLIRMERVHDAIVGAASRPYAFGRNCCLSLIRRLVGVGGHPPGVVRAVDDALHAYRRTNYFAAMTRAHELHGTVGAAMVSELVAGAGLPPAEGHPRPGDVLLFEGSAIQVDHKLVTTGTRGTLEVVVDDVCEWWVWTTQGLRPVGEAYDRAALKSAGGVRCLLPLQ